MKIRQLFEAFDSNYPISYEGDNGAVSKYKFITDSNKPYYIYVQRMILGPVQRDFYEQSFGVQLADDIPDGIDYSFYQQDSDGSMRMRYNFNREMTTNKEDSPMKIFSTAINFAKKYLEKSGAAFMVFEGEEDLGGLYKVMIRRHLPREYVAYEQKSGKDMKFFIVRKEYIE
jgi:hypothetical protein